MNTIPTALRTPIVRSSATATSTATDLQPHQGPCPACCGEGYLVHVGAPGYYDDHEGCWMPSETLDPCDACQGTGREGARWSSPDPEITAWSSRAELTEPVPPLDF